MKTNVSQNPEWWTALPETEKIVLRNAILAVRLLTKSGSPQIARAAHKWDATISCFIRTRLINGRRSRRSDDAAVGRLLRGGNSRALVDSSAPASSAVPAFASGKLLSPAPIRLKSRAAGERSRQGDAGAQG